MAKIFTACWLFAIFAFYFHPLNASPWPVCNSLEEECTAPPPDSISATVIGSGSIKVKWHPNQSNDLFSILTLKENVPSGVWDTIGLLQHLQGNNFVFTNLTPGRYKFGVATECSNGGHGIYHFTDPTGFVLDLVLSGRTPVNPSTVQECIVPIHYQEFNWVGFKVETSGGLGSAANYFEIKAESGVPPQIKRDSGPIRIVAATLKSPKKFPYPPSNTLVNSESMTFSILRVDGPFVIPVGDLTLTIDESSTPKTLTVCKENPANWNNSYIFTMMVAQSANGLNAPDPIDRGEFRKLPHEKISIANPVNSDAIIFAPSSFIGEKIKIQMFNLLGELVFNDIIVPSTEVIELRISDLSTGVYFMIIGPQNGESQIIKLQKF